MVSQRFEYTNEPWESCSYSYSYTSPKLRGIIWRIYDPVDLNERIAFNPDGHVRRWFAEAVLAIRLPWIQGTPTPEPWESYTWEQQGATVRIYSGDNSRTWEGLLSGDRISGTVKNPTGLTWKWIAVDCRATDCSTNASTDIWTPTGSPCISGTYEVTCDLGGTIWQSDGFMPGNIVSFSRSGTILSWVDEPGMWLSSYYSWEQDGVSVRIKAPDKERSTWLYLGTIESDLREYMSGTVTDETGAIQSWSASRCPKMVNDWVWDSSSYPETKPEC